MNRLRKPHRHAIALLCAVIAAAAVTGGFIRSGGSRLITYEPPQTAGESIEAFHAAGAPDGAEAEIHSIPSGAMNANKPRELWTAQDLLKIAEEPTKNYVLMADINLDGIPWTPIPDYTGTFEGNDHTISNVTITQSVDLGDHFMGFFGHIGEDGEVKNLHLENICLTADADTDFMGSVAGSVSGKILNCTATGILTDDRTTASCIGVGVLAGRMASATVTGGTGVTISCDARNHPDELTGLCADVAFQLAAEPTYQMGLVGWYASGTVSGLWRDRSNDTALLSPTEQERRQTVVDYMYEICTVEWTPSEYMVYAPKGVSTANLHYREFFPGTTYYGLPYGHTASSLDRFLSCMESVDGINTVKEGLFTEDELYAVYDYTKTGNTEGRTTGWATYMANDCSSAVGQAWQTISPTKVNDDAGDAYGGAYVYYSEFMIPNAINQAEKGILSVGDYITGDYTTTQTLFDANGEDDLSRAQAIAESYALAHMGDALVGYDAQPDGSDAYGHVRMLSQDPVIIRNADGTIDLEKSYCITHEQGDGLYGNKYDTDYDSPYTSCRADYYYSLNALLNYPAYRDLSTKEFVEQVGSAHRYIPVTIRAFTADELPDMYATELATVSAPNAGKLYSNYYVIKATLNVIDSGGVNVYTQTAYNNVGTANSVYRTNGGTVDLSRLFADFSDAELASGDYLFFVKLYASNGQTIVCGKENGGDTRADLNETITQYWTYTVS